MEKFTTTGTRLKKKKKNLFVLTQACTDTQAGPQRKPIHLRSSDYLILAAFITILLSRKAF